MKILKRPENLIFDTENPDHIEFNRKTIKTKVQTALHQNIESSEFEYLNRCFKRGEKTQHPIFKDFGLSYYSIIE